MSEGPVFHYRLAGAFGVVLASASGSRSSTGGRARRRRRPHAAVNHARPSEENVKDVVFRALFDEYWPRVRRHLDCYVDDRDEVDELTAEVFVAAWRKLDPAQPMALAWFLRTANNKLRDRTRRARSHDRAMEALVRGLQNPSHPLDPMEAIALRNAIRKLSAREQQVVVLTYWDDLTAGEVADVLRTSQGAVWTTLTRARTKLREQLEGGAPTQ